MDLWFTESDMKTYGLVFKIKKTLYVGKSKYQTVAVFETVDMGRLLVLDGLVMSCEYDEFAYHEMIAHVPLYTHPSPENVLIIGGGDGGTVREVVKHDIVKSVDLVEIDEEVIKVTKEYLPVLGSAFDSPKLNIHIGDGIEYVKDTDKRYDVIIVDGSDPMGPAVGLFSESFYRDCYERLKEDGIMVAQTETPYDVNLRVHVPQIYKNIRKVFPDTRMYIANVACYPSGMWSFAFATKKYDPIKDFQGGRYEKDGFKLKYYNDQIHKACFILPNFVRDFIDG